MHKLNVYAMARRDFVIWQRTNRQLAALSILGAPAYRKRQLCNHG
ncbi:hypothetical protein [Nitratireductor sp. CH_MIT9313-5]|jgi:hypothetical protein